MNIAIWNVISGFQSSSSNPLVDVTVISGFTTNDVYYGTDLIDYNLTGFSWWMVVDPIVNTSTNNIQRPFGNTSWDHPGNAGWGFRAFQGAMRPILDGDQIGSATIQQKTAQGSATSNGELGYMQVLHCVIRNNVVFMYKNGKIIGHEGVNGPGLSKPSKINAASTLGVSIGGIGGSPSQRKHYEGGFISGGICQSTGLTDQQVADHYAALLADNPYATPTGATNAWKAPDAGATWTDHIGGYVMTRYGTPTITETKMAFYKAYDVSAPFGDTAPMYPQMTGTIRVLGLGDSRTNQPGSYRFVANNDMVAKGMDIEWVGRFPNPADYFITQLGYPEQSNGMPGVSAQQCIAGTYNFPPLVEELVTHDPDVVVIWFGNNSVDNYQSSKGDIATILDLIYAYNPDVRVLLCSEISGIRQGVLPSGAGLQKSAQFHDYNKWSQGEISIRRNQGMKISYGKIDLGVKWDDDNDWPIGDNVHTRQPDIRGGTLNISHGDVKTGEVMWQSLRYLCGYN